jgi:hypothetical protein
LYRKEHTKIKKYRAMKIYVTAVEALRKMRKHAETPFITKIGGKATLGPSYFVLENFHSKLCV